MRIAYLTSQYPAASHTFIRREVKALRRAGIDIATFSVRGPAADELRSEDDRAAHAETGYILPARPSAVIAAHVWALSRAPRRYVAALRLALRHRVPGGRALLWALFHFVEAMLLARMLRGAGVERLHNHFANSGANIGLIAATYLGLRWSLTLHGISETDYPAGVLLPEKLAAADFAACVSWFGRAQAMRITAPALWDRLILVRCGIDPAALPTRRRAAGGPPRIICVGRLSPEKGQPGLLEAFARLKGEGLAAELVLVGDGPEQSALVARTAALGLGACVDFRGRLPETETLAAIADADLLVLPSFMEGLPVVLMEAMALGVPVIAAQVAGIPELVQDGRTGLLFPPSDWDALADAIRRMLGEPEAAERMAAAGRARVMEQFAIDAAVVPLVARFRGDVDGCLAAADYVPGMEKTT